MKLYQNSIPFYTLVIIVLSFNLCQCQELDSLFFDDFGGNVIENDSTGTVSYYYESYTENIDKVGEKMIKFFKRNPEIETVFSNLIILKGGQVDFPKENRILFSPYCDDSKCIQIKRKVERIIKRMETYFINEKGYANISNHVYIKNNEKEVRIIINGYDDYNFSKIR